MDIDPELGVLEGGLVTVRKEGTPEGGPLSPLLSNVLLTDLDRELERRGHKFCRYADDCNTYVKSEKAGQRVLDSLTHFLENKLKLRVNRDKSGVGPATKRKFLGHTMYRRQEVVHLRIAPAVLARFKGDLRQVLRRNRGCSLDRIIDELNPKLRGWMAYFRHIGVTGILTELDGWIRRHLRQILWVHWKRPYTLAINLMRLGISEERAWISACNQRGPWWNAGASHMNQAVSKRLFDRLGLVSLVDTFHHRLRRLT